MDSRTAKNATHESDDMEFFLKHEIPVEQIRSILRHRKMSEDKVDSTLSKLMEAKERVRKYANRFIEKIDQHYGLHDIPTIVKKAVKFAEKHQLSNIEREVIISMAMKGDVYNTFNPSNDLKYSEMSKFMGIESPAGQVLNIQTKDYAPLNEIVKLFETTRILHMDIKNQLSLYRDCAYEAISGEFDRNKHNLSTHIHPVVAALFLPKIEAVEKRMLYSNLGRVVLQRALPYLNKHVQLYDNVLPGELEAEWELTCDIIQDPNSLAYFSDDTPVTNMMKRFKIQIELWKNVLNLRQGRYFSVGYDENDGINGFLKTLNQYDWTYFDSPDMFHLQDEGSVLRKILAVFSVRPTFAQISSLQQRSFMGFANFTGLARTTHLRIPIINVRLPAVAPNNLNLPMPQIHLERAINQSDYFIENKLLVPKNKSIMYSIDFVFFYINRRFQNSTLANLTYKFSYTNVPYQTVNVGQTSVNDLPVGFDYNMKIGSDVFDLRSVVTVYRPPIAENVSVGSSCVVIRSASPGVTGDHFYYNPLLANISMDIGGAPVSNKPISVIHRTAGQPDEVGFIEMAQKFGTIFMYVKA
jgi:hypothetical protein